MPPAEVAATFFEAWQQQQYGRMYDLLSHTAQTITTPEVFTRRYANIHDGIGESRTVVRVTGSPQPVPEGVQVPFTVTRTVALFGEVSETNSLPLVEEQGAWRVAWQPSLIFNGLTQASSVRVLPEYPRRGRILDRNGKPLADNGSVLAVGVVPGEIQDEAALLTALSSALDLPPDTIKQRYQGGQPDWFMPITTRRADERPELQTRIGGVPGVALQDQPARVYPLADAAAHVIGYVSHPTADELRTLATSGYDESDWVGRAGLEAAAEARLAGRKGGSIRIVDPSGRVFRTIVEQPASPGEDLRLNLD
ncbi:MAG: penicillin-binding protein 2, partial [Chloroflexota bacterium]|nr:penicillin-binding protein 2 [Chloroflexota bacterium]